MSEQEPDKYLSDSEKSELKDIVKNYKGGLTKFAKDAKISDLAVCRALAGLDCQRGSISLMRDYLSRSTG